MLSIRDFFQNRKDVGSVKSFESQRNKLPRNKRSIVMNSLLCSSKLTSFLIPFKGGMKTVKLQKEQKITMKYEDSGPYDLCTSFFLKSL